MAAINELPPPAPSLTGKHVTHNRHSCPSCGSHVPVDMSELEEARRRVAELERQMEFLKEKAIAAGRSIVNTRDQPLHGHISHILNHHSGQMRRLRRPDTKSQNSTRKGRLR